MNKGSQETWFTVFAFIVSGVLIALTMIFVGLELLL